MPLISTSLVAAFTIGRVTSGFPNPTRTKHPPDLVLNIPNLYKRKILCLSVNRVIRTLNPALVPTLYGCMENPHHLVPNLRLLLHHYTLWEPSPPSPYLMLV